MNNNFPRILALLRKEKGISQKKAAESLGISQALLSHYEKGIRECGLDFVLKVAAFYNVSCDYLLGRSPDRSGATLSFDDIAEPDQKQDKKYKGSILPTLNKRLLTNSINIVFEELSVVGNTNLTNEVSAMLMIAVYKAFRAVYSIHPKNPQGLFSVDQSLYPYYSSAAAQIAEANALALSKGQAVGSLKGVKSSVKIELSPEIISSKYPDSGSTSLLNLIKNCEVRMIKKTPEKTKDA